MHHLMLIDKLDRNAPNTTNATTWACPGGALINPVLLGSEGTPPLGFIPWPTLTIFSGPSAPPIWSIPSPFQFVRTRPNSSIVRR